MIFDYFNGRERPEVETKTWRNPIEIVFENGDRWVSETTMTHYDDWWDTPLGPVNFGRAHLRTRHFTEHGPRPAESEVEE